MAVDRFVTLERFCYSPMGTFGQMRVFGRNASENFLFYTVELPWHNNQDRISCIPCGEYGLVLGTFYGGDGVGGKRDYPAYELQNVPDRDLIKIHVGNTTDDVRGCIAPGIDLGYNLARLRWAVVQSQSAFNMFMDKMEGRSGLLKISNYIGGIL